VAVEPTGRFAYVMSYDGQGIAAFSISGTTGALTALAGPPVAVGREPECIAVDPTGRFVYVTNTLDRNISAFAIDGPSGALTEVPGSPFVAPPVWETHYPVWIAIHPAGRFAYVTNGGSNSISSFSIDAATGALAPVTGAPFYLGPSPRSIAIGPLGSHLYVTFWAAPSEVARCSIDPDSGVLFYEPGSVAGDYASALVIVRIAQ
jgi:DNA-binding beta-propeller fold protein YncE